MKDYLSEIVRLSLGDSPEDLLGKTLEMCIAMAGATGGSILGEEGPCLQFLFADAEELIGTQVPFDSIAGISVNRGVVVYTYAPRDERHFSGVDARVSRETQYLLSVPIPSIQQARKGVRRGRNAGALQLLFDRDVFPLLDPSGGRVEMDVRRFKREALGGTSLEPLFRILPLVAFALEVMNLRRTSYQVIHELKNKLIAGQSWMGYLREDMRRRAPDLLAEADVKDDLELATAAMREGSALAKRYLELTKIYTLNPQPTDLNAVLEETAAAARALVADLAAGRVAVKLALDANVPERTVDAGQIKMALFNLCKNGVEALIEHGVPGAELRLTSSRWQDQVRLRIADNGPGIPAEVAGRLFVAFQTKKEGGTGLGLTITKKIIDVHGGTIQCETGERGTAFVVTL